MKTQIHRAAITVFALTVVLLTASIAYAKDPAWWTYQAGNISKGSQPFNVVCHLTFSDELTLNSTITFPDGPPKPTLTCIFTYSNDKNQEIPVNFASWSGTMHVDNTAKLDGWTLEARTTVNGKTWVLRLNSSQGDDGKYDTFGYQITQGIQGVAWTVTSGKWVPHYDESVE